MKKHDLFITGYGLITPMGANIPEMRTGLMKGTTHFQHHREIEGTEGVSLLAAYVSEEHLIRGIHPRILRKLDRFTLLSMQAFQQTLESAFLEGSSLQDFGIFLGNSTGGWTFVEPQLHDIYNGQFDHLSPYVATAWFPTAPQGEISIQHQVSGYSKTFAAGSLSAAYALEHACDLVRQGYLAGAFAGGVEAPLSPLVYNACLRTEPLSFLGEYFPFHTRASGYIMGEGAGFLTIESEEALSKRGVSALARIAGIGFGATLSKSIERCLQAAERNPMDVNCIFLDAKGTCAWDQEEYLELEKIFAFCKDVHLTTTKPLHGSLLSADFAVQAVLAVLCLRDEMIPRGLWSRHGHIHPSFGKLVLDIPVSKSLKNVLFYARDLDGTSISVLIDRCMLEVI